MSQKQVRRLLTDRLAQEQAGKTTFVKKGFDEKDRSSYHTLKNEERKIACFLWTGRPYSYS